MYLRPGQISVVSEPTLITTVLGSCVSVCLWDRTRHVAGINHYLLPDNDRPTQSARYGDDALALLLDAVIDAGARTDRLDARVYGGARMFGDGPLASRVGDRNVARAHEFLRAQHIRVVDADTGGERARRLLFDTGDGSALVRVIGEWRIALSG